MERNVAKDLLKWKDKRNRKPLLVTGVRQCGKTYIIKDFGKTQFEECAYFNFDGNSGLQSIFDYDLDPVRITDELGSMVYGKQIVPGKTLVIFDEIQACPRALMSLKYFCEDFPELHVIGAGSLLGVALKKEGISFPVGKVDRLKMQPMSFDEFVRAAGGEKYVNALLGFAGDREIPELYRIPMEKYLKDYYIVGGMPEAVQTWVDTHDYGEADEVLNRILSDYADDFGKYTSADTEIKIRLVWNSIPVQIAKDNNKFVFSHVKSGARAKDLEDALEWLVNSGLVYKLELVSNPEIPLSGAADSTFFKVYMSDVGLLRKKAGIDYRTILAGDELYVHYKGALAENYVLSQLKALDIGAYYWRTKSDAELDFIAEYNGSIIPIEVKSADNTKAKSLRIYCGRYQPRIAVKTSLKNVGKNTDGTTDELSIPLYLLFKLKNYFDGYTI